MSQSSRSSGKSCLLIGCSTLVVLAILGVIGVVLAWKWGPSMLTKRYTAEAPVALPEVKMAEPDFDALTNRVADFAMAYVFSNAATLTLSEPEMNALIVHNKDNPKLKDRLRVHLKGDEITGEFTVPVEEMASQMNWESLKGRHFNGSAGLRVSLIETNLNVSIQSLSLNGRPVPDFLYAKIRGKNLALEVAKNPKTGEFFERVQSVTIKDSKLVITLRGAAASPQ